MNEPVKKRILFVDDEPLILNGLQRTLRKMRNEWEMTFTASGKEALEVLGTTPMDVIVSDLKMPEMDGAQLLALVKKQYPHMVRLILSGHIEHDMTIKSVQIAHQCLAKPCEAEILRETLSKVFALRDFLADESIKKIVSKSSPCRACPQSIPKLSKRCIRPIPRSRRWGTLFRRISV